MQRDFTQTTLQPLTGTGPYQIVDHKVGHSVTFSRDVHYWGQSLPINQGRHNFDTIHYKYFRDENVALTAFKAGRYDWRMENVAKFWATQYTGDQFTNGLIKKVQINSKQPNGMQAFAMNTRREVFQDIHVRRALNRAFDFQWLNQNLFYGSYTRSESFYNNSLFAARNPMSLSEQQLLTPYAAHLPVEIWSQPFYFKSMTSHQNLVLAQQDLDQSDWILVNNQRVHKKTGQPLSFTLLINAPSMSRIALPYQKALQQLGINMKIQLISPSDWIARVRHFDFDMTTYVWPAPESPGSEQFLFWHSSQAKLPGSGNIMGVENTAIDYIVSVIQRTDDRELLTTYVHALDRILMWNYYVIPHWYISSNPIAYWQCISPPTTHPDYAIDLASWYQAYPCQETALQSA